MSQYHHYHTEAFVCKQTPYRESDMQIKFLTKELGLLTVRVQSSRKISSKHRMLLGLYSFCEINIIKGKGGWRLIGIKPTLNNKYTHQETWGLAVLANMSNLVLKLTHGEEPLSDVFDWFINVAQFLKTNRDPLSKNHTDQVNTIAAAQLVGLFGYASFAIPNNKKLLTKKAVTVFLNDEKQKRLKQLIHEALVQSQLI